jgi:hypothetical protein
VERSGGGIVTTKKSGRADGRIDVKTYEPKEYEGPTGGGPKLVEIHVTEAFSGDIQGEGKVRFLQAARADGSASFVGIERVTGSLAGRKGSFLLQDSGTLAGENVTGEWFVVPGSGTGELVGLRGEGGFKATLGQSSVIWLDYRFE